MRSHGSAHVRSMLAKPTRKEYPHAQTEIRIGVIYETKDITPSISENRFNWSGNGQLINRWLRPDGD